MRFWQGWAMLALLSAYLLGGAVTWGQAQSPDPGAAARGPGLDPRGETLQFGVFDPQRRAYQIEKVEISHEGVKPVQVKLSITGLRHEETNFALDPTQWCDISPREGTASRDHPFLTNITVRFPKKMPGGIPDGLFSGRLKIESPEATAPLEVPIQFTLDLPDFITEPPDLAETGMRVGMTCCLPGSRRSSLRVGTDAPIDQTVRVVPPSVLINEQTGAALAGDQVRVVLAANRATEGETTIAAGASPTRIPLITEVQHPRLGAGQYTGELAIRSEMGRTLYVPFRLIIPETFWVRWISWIGIAVVCLSGIFILAMPLRGLRQGRYRFRGSTLTVGRNGPQGVLPGPWGKILTLTYIEEPEERWELSSPRCTVRATPADPFAPPQRVALRNPADPLVQNPTAISLICPGERYELQVGQWASNRLQFRITQSPHRRGRLMVQLWLSLLLLGAGLITYGWPAIWCRLLP